MPQPKLGRTLQENLRAPWRLQCRDPLERMGAKVLANRGEWSSLVLRRQSEH